jgi:hypothetical protein
MEVSDKQALLNKNGSGIGRECGVTPQVRHFKTGVLQAPYRGGNGTRVPHACGHDAQAALAGELTPGDGIRPGMLSFPEACGYSWRWRSACNMRKGFEGLSALVGTVP